MGGCALTSKSEPLQVRYFDPERRRDVDHLGQDRSCRVSSRSAGSAPAPISGRRLRFELRPTRSATTRRFAGPRGPTTTFGAGSSATLFDDYGCRRSVSGSGPTLDLELTAFEEERRTPQPAARVAVRFVLSDEHTVLHEETIDLTRPLVPGNASDLLDRLVRAISETLVDAVNQVAQRVAVAVRTMPARGIRGRGVRASERRRIYECDRGGASFALARWPKVL